MSSRKRNGSEEVDEELEEESDLTQILAGYFDRLNSGEMIHKEEVLSEHPSLATEILSQLNAFQDFGHFHDRAGIPFDEVDFVGGLGFDATFQLGLEIIDHQPGIDDAWRMAGSNAQRDGVIRPGRRRERRDGGCGGGQN